MFEVVDPGRNVSSRTLVREEGDILQTIYERQLVEDTIRDKRHDQVRLSLEIIEVSVLEEYECDVFTASVNS